MPKAMVYYKSVAETQQPAALDRNKGKGNSIRAHTLGLSPDPPRFGLCDQAVLVLVLTFLLL